MKFNISSKSFYEAISQVAKVIKSKNAFQILNNFLITLQENTLSVTASDLEHLLTATIEVSDAKGEGSFCVDAKRLVDIFKEIPEQGVTMEIDERLNVTIRYSSGESTFVALPGNEYPDYKSEDDTETAPATFTMPAPQLVHGIENTLFAVAVEDYRPTMMGIYLDIKPDGITFVATDTRKLVKYTDKTGHPGVTTNCILPAKPANILRTVFSGDEEISASVTRKSATFSNSRFTLNCRFIVGNFPDYNRVIPRSNNIELTVDRESLMSSVRRVGVAIEPGYGLEKFKITPDNIEIKTADLNLNTHARENVPCSFTGQELIIGFSAPFLLEMLAVLKTTDIQVLLADPGRPGIFKPTENQPDTELIMLLMPMTVGEF